jgi:PmbA protein
MSDPEIERQRGVVRRALDRARKAGASAADAVLVEDASLEARVRDTEVDFVKQASEKVLGIRALVAGEGGLSSAVTSTSDLSDDAVDRMAAETVALARETAPDPTAGLPGEGYAADWPDLDLLEEGDRNVQADARIEDALAAEAAARAVDPRIANSEGSQVGSGHGRIVYGNTDGFLGDYASASHSLFSEPLAIDGDDKQRDYWMTVGRKLSDLDDPSSVGRRAAERALRRLGARRVATCEVPIIFDPVTAPSLLRHLVSCLSGYAIYRDASFLSERMGEKIASDLVTVVDDGRLPGGLGSKPFDGEGLPTRRNVLVEAGELRSWLLDAYSGRKLGLASTGNASRGAGSAPSVGATNLWLEPGERSLDELVAETDRGLLVTELIGMGFNPVNGDYSRGAAGLWIEGGEIQYPVQEITIAGHLGDMLADIDAVASELLWLGRVASPAVRIARMTVAGE